MWLLKQELPVDHTTTCRDKISKGAISEKRAIHNQWLVKKRKLFSSQGLISFQGQVVSPRNLNIRPALNRLHRLYMTMVIIEELMNSREIGEHSKSPRGANDINTVYSFIKSLKTLN